MRRAEEVVLEGAARRRTPSGRRATAAAVAAIALPGLAASPALGAKDATLLVSLSDAGVKGTAASQDPAISATGRFVAFASDAQLNIADTGDSDVYVRDLQTGTTLLVSRVHATGVKGAGDSSAPSISADGRFVAFQSEASLHADDGDLVADVYVRDLQANTTTLVSRVDGTGANTLGTSTAPAISADGNRVAFVSSAQLHDDDDDPVNDVYRRDTLAGTTDLVSRAAVPDGANVTNPSDLPSISADGSRVSFQSIAGNLHPDDTDALDDIFLRDLVAGSTILVSRATSGIKGNGSSRRSALSPDGRYVAFDSQSTNLDAADTSTGPDVYLRDLQASTTTLVSRAEGPTGARANNALAPSVSAGGRYVAFDSSATSLHPEDDDVLRDVYVRDLQAHTLTLVSRAGGRLGEKGNAASDSAAISQDGRFVAYDSAAANLDPADLDAIRDVFARDVLGPPDVTPPVITVPAGIAAVATGPGGAVVTYAASASDDVDGPVVVSCTPPSGATFAIGATTVTCTAVDDAGNSSSASFGVVVAAQPVTPPPPAPPPPAPPPPPPPAVPPVERSTAQLSIRRATIDRGRRLLIVSGSISSLSSGSVVVQLRSAGRRVRILAPIVPGGRISVRRRISAAQAALQTGPLTISYAGDADTRAQSVRLRAGSRRPVLKVARPTLVGNRLRARGTIAAAARGRVRVQLEYVHGGQAKSRVFSARIARGRWKLDVRLSAPVLAEISGRAGPVHAYTLFAGHASGRMAGELLYAQVLGAR